MNKKNVWLINQCVLAVLSLVFASTSAAQVSNQSSGAPATRPASRPVLGEGTKLPNRGVNLGVAKDLDASTSGLDASCPTCGTQLNYVTCTGGRSWTSGSCVCPSGTWNGLICQPNVTSYPACGSNIGSYGIASGYTSGNFTLVTTAGGVYVSSDISGCSQPNVTTTPLCGSNIGSYGIPSGYTSGSFTLVTTASGTFVSANISGCSMPPSPPPPPVAAMPIVRFYAANGSPLDFSMGPPSSATGAVWNICFVSSSTSSVCASTASYTFGSTIFVNMCVMASYNRYDSHYNDVYGSQGACPYRWDSATSTTVPN